MANRKQETEEHTRDALVNAAVSLLAEVDVGSLSLREVARRAGLSHAAPYNHFADKDALVRAVAARGFSSLERAMEDTQAAAPTTPHEQLVAAGVGYILFARREPALFQLMFKGLEADDAKGPFTRLQRCVAALGPRDERALKSDALFCWAHVHGLAVMFTSRTLEPFGVDDADEVALARVHCERLLPALRG